MVKLPERSTGTPDSVTVRVSGASREQLREMAYKLGTSMSDVADFVIGAAYESGLTPAEIAGRLGVQVAAD